MTIAKKEYVSSLPLIIKFIASCLFTAIFSVLSYKLYQICGERPLMFLHREFLVVLLYAFLLINVFVDYKFLYNLIFKYRYLLAACALVFLVVAKINFSSIGMFNYYIQPTSGSEFTTPIFGTARAIRSDEWAVSTPRTLTYQYCKGETYNDIIMATDTPNSSAASVSPSLAILGNIFRIGYLFLGAEYAVSFYWASSFLVGLLGSVELCYIISGKQKLISVVGGVMIVLSSFYLWWSGNDIIVNGIAACVCIYYFLNTNSRKFRILMGFLIAVFGSSFVCVLYPAWQVPFGYLCLAFIIWCFVNNFSNIKTFKLVDWLILSGTVVFAGIIILVYFLNQMEYMTAITQTVYPGARFCVGGEGLNKLFYYPASFRFPFDSDKFPVSEYGTFFSFFPLPAILSVYLFFKSKKKDLLSILLLVVCIFLTVYCGIGFPEILAKITLLYTSPSNRAIDIIGLLQIFLLMRCAYLIKHQEIKVSKIIFIPVCLIVAAYTVYRCNKTLPYANYMSIAYMVAVGIYIAVSLLSFCDVFRNKLKNAFLVLFVVVQCAVSVNVWPIQKGLDVIYSKPVSKEIIEIVKESPDAVWIANNQNVEANFYAACGAKVINSNNYMPNMKLWNQLFPNGEHEEIYNRYAHLMISLTENDTTPALLQADVIALYLNYADLEELDVEYVISKSPVGIPEEYKISCDEIYFEEGIYIYKLSYN